MYLLETHTLIWFIEGDDSLPNHLKLIIGKPENDIFVSLASLWGIAIKRSIGKLPISKDVEQIYQGLKDDNFQILSIENSHIKLIESLPLHH
jgi:PIN domain nuclease of toxin-antitoxin system